MHLSPQKATSVTLAMNFINNYLRNRKSAHYTPPGTFDSEDADGNIIPCLWRAVNTNDDLLHH
jgi:hypothetical protein